MQQFQPEVVPAILAQKTEEKKTKEKPKERVATPLTTIDEAFVTGFSAAKNS